MESAFHIPVFLKYFPPDGYNRYNRMIDQIVLVKNLIIPNFSLIISSIVTDLLRAFKSISIDGFATSCKHINEGKITDVN